MSEVVVINAEGQIVGRMSGHIAKALLQGRSVWVVNAERAVISGKKSSILGEYSDFVDIKSRVQPKYTPRHPRKPENFVRMVVAGMVPRHKAKGLQALKRLRVSRGDPGGYHLQPVKFPDADAKRLKGRYITVGELLSYFGWERSSTGEVPK